MTDQGTETLCDYCKLDFSEHSPIHLEICNSRLTKLEDYSSGVTKSYTEKQIQSGLQERFNKEVRRLAKDSDVTSIER